MSNKHKEKQITKRLENYSQWYFDIVEVADLAEHGPVRGTMIIKPYGYSIWELIKKGLNKRIKDTGVRNAYFPLFIPEKFLKKEQEHVKGFSPEIAAVTYAGGKKLERPIIVRPTSETIIYNSFSDWIHSYKDLPLLINQWANVVRWELKPKLFLRTTEFLWQEGHTVHETAKEADKRARSMLNLYKIFFKEYMAIPTIAGSKTKSERFAGAEQTYTLEAMMQDGKALQIATSHNLGQNFAKAFDINFLNKDGDNNYCYQTSWGVSTRVMGGLIMVHSDDIGLVLPPRVAPIQVVIIPIYRNNIKNKEKIDKKIDHISHLLEKDNIRFKVDREEKSIGKKFYKWEKKGVPLRIELGPKELKDNSFLVTRRNNGDSNKIKIKETSLFIQKILNEMHDSLYKKALDRMKNNTKKVSDWKDFVKAINDQKFVLSYWSGEEKTEDKIKEETGATIRCIPFSQKETKGKGIYSKKESNKRVLFGKTY